MKFNLNEIEEQQEWFKEVLDYSFIKVAPSERIYARRIHQIRCIHKYYDLSPVPQFKAQFKYLAGTALILWLALKSFFSGLKVKGSLIIWDSNVEDHVSCETFKRFIDSGQVLKPEDNVWFIIKSRQDKKVLERAIFCKRPLLDTLLFIQLCPRDVLRLLRELVSGYIKFNSLLLSHHYLTDMWKDFLTSPLVNLYEKKGMRSLFRTNSENLDQEFWTERIDFHTAWYSTNSYFNLYKGFSEKHLEFPYLYVCHYGTSWTWNKRHADWLNRAFGEQKVHVVGPVLFYPDDHKQKVEGAKRRVLVFDVTPQNRDFVRRKILKHGLIYYCDEICGDFIKDIVRAFEGTGWQVELKPKRRYSSNHSKTYINFLGELQKEFSHFKAIPSQQNLFDEVATSDVVITIPFSSPFDLGKAKGVPTFLYDPTGLIDFEKMGFSPEDYVSDYQGLVEKTKKLLK